jgi:catechol 2,3-dioxygenase-like lactoylglutathione lyase family enzyme
MLQAISHVALIVADPSRTAELFQQLFAVKTVRRLDEEGHDETFMRLGTTWFLLAQAAVDRKRTGDHIAFRVTREVLRSTLEKLQAMKLEHILAREDSSLYFFDYDNHVFELDTSDIENELNQLG